MSLNLIPQIFYDVIARIIPGLTLIFSGYITFVSPSIFIDNLDKILSNKNLFSFASIALILILSYFLGLVLREIWDLTINNLLEKRRKLQEQKSKELRIQNYNRIRKLFNEPELQIKPNDLPDVFIIHDHLRLCSNSEAIRLLKIKAEKRLFETLFIGFTILAIINPFFLISGWHAFGIDRIILEIILLICICLVWKRSLVTDNYYVSGTYGQWLFLNFPVGQIAKSENMG